MNHELETGFVLANLIDIAAIVLEKADGHGIEIPKVENGDHVDEDRLQEDIALAVKLNLANVKMEGAQ